ncbi:hypothetical protein SCHPADRAFT_910823 [Schizopora paradoxa]|uniref:BSD domain-containing protein n=1 Tax=Schizopora paradoxa TaxID=27342 RepID=A0A0H2R1W5_9AGAM|nr:hypothetical protein SCHPADRAFT_910823 [Schizopora paradoxa]
MPSTTSNLCQAKASYKKIPGLLELTKSHLNWTATGKQKADLRIPTSQAASLFCSKEGSPQVKLKLALVGNDAGHTFMFTSPQASAEREVFKTELTMMISENRSNSSAQQQKVQQQHDGAANGTPRSFPAVSRATSVSSGRASSLGPSGAPDDLQLRRKVLVKNADLAKLHRELVLSGQITEAEFWEGRESLLVAEASQENQKRGRPGKLVDPRPQEVNGDTKIVITPQLVHDIFEEYPVVAKAYSENVPKPMKEGEFWTRYFKSRLFDSHRASIRQSAAQHTINVDPIFDKYVEKDDDELEPRRQRDEEVDIFVDLVTSQEDHVETGNKRDLTMQAGRQRGALPLIRKFNEHSERLLNAAEGGFPSKKRRIDDGQSLYDIIDLDDLRDGDSSNGIVLEMKDRDRYYDGRTGDQSSSEDKPVFRTVLPEVRGQLNGWSKALGSLKIDRKAGDAALQSMTQNVQARLEVKLQKNDIPESVFSQMRTCQTAANEFLRQYWSSIFPPPSDPQTLGTSTPAQKAAKAAKMIGYLASTQDKVDAIIKAASSAGAEPAKIEVAMKPVLNAVEKALQFHRNRRPIR